MAAIEVKCIRCGSGNVYLHGEQRGHKRCRCRDCKRVFQLSYTNKACEEGMKEKIITMAHNGNGIRDTARVLGISPYTVINEIKKKSPKLNT